MKELNKIRKVLKDDGISIIDMPYEDDRLIKVTKAKHINLKIKELLWENIGDYGYPDKAYRQWWIASILSTVFSKVPKGYFSINAYVAEEIRKTWTWKDKIRAFIFKRL